MKKDLCRAYSKWLELLEGERATATKLAELEGLFNHLRVMRAWNSWRDVWEVLHELALKEEAKRYPGVSHPGPLRPPRAHGQA